MPSIVVAAGDGFGQASPIFAARKSDNGHRAARLLAACFLLILMAAPARAQEFFAFADPLYWGSWSDDFRNQFDTSLDIDHDWSVGVRGGLGLQHPWGWKASWAYTNLNADDTRLWTDVSAPGDAYSSYGDLDYQVHDFEVGRIFCLSHRMEIEPFAGFRWGQIDYTAQDSMGGATSNTIRLDSKTDSYGLRLGAKGKVRLPGNFSIFGQGAATGMISTTENQGSLLSPATTWNITDDHENHCVDAAAGVMWEYCLLEVSAGYEWNFWADSIQRRSSGAVPDYENLKLEGVFGRFVARY